MLKPGPCPDEEKAGVDTNLQKLHHRCRRTGLPRCCLVKGVLQAQQAADSTLARLPFIQTHTHTLVTVDETSLSKRSMLHDIERHLSVAKLNVIQNGRCDSPS